MVGWLGKQHVQGNTLTLNQHSDQEHAPEPSIVSPAGPTPAADSASERADPIEACLVWVLEHIGRPMSRAALRARTAREPRPWVIEVAVEALESLGVRYAPRRIKDADSPTSMHWRWSRRLIAVPWCSRVDVAAVKRSPISLRSKACGP